MHPTMLVFWNIFPVIAVRLLRDLAYVKAYTIVPRMGAHDRTISEWRALKQGCTESGVPDAAR